jgi:enterochelin esterase-like enzyme
MADAAAGFEGVCPATFPLNGRNYKLYQRMSVQENKRQQLLNSQLVKKLKILTAVLSSLLSLAAQAVDISGQWRAEIDTQIGRQKYLYTFKVEGEKLTGMANAQVNGEKREAELLEGKIAGDTVTFAEMIKFQESDIRIEYTGKIGTNEIKFARHVGDFATEEFLAKRVAITNASVVSNTAAEHPDNRGGGRGFGGPIVLNADDKPAFADAPPGFDVARDGIAHGQEELIEYNSKTVGTRRKMTVYTPPGYSKDKKYPVLYLLHGIGGDETEWQRFVAPNILLDNLFADGKVVPMIVVMPNGRAQKNDNAEGDIFKAGPAFANFERDLLDDVIPAIEARYAASTHRQDRALAGLSMGGGQSLNFGLSHLDSFAWVGSFSCAPNTKPPAELVPDPVLVTQKLKLLWLSAGNQDGLIRISQGVHAYLKEKNVPHIWNVDGNAHNTPEWKNNLYWFSQQLFK